MDLLLPKKDTDCQNGKRTNHLGLIRDTSKTSEGLRKVKETSLKLGGGSQRLQEGDDPSLRPQPSDLSLSFLWPEWFPEHVV